MKANKRAMLIVGIALMLCGGMVFSWSIFVQPIESELGFARKDTSLVFPISLSISILGQFFAGLIIKHFKPRYNFILAAILLATGFIMASYLQTITALYISYGVFVGIAIGMLFNGVLSTVVSHYDDKRSFVSSLLLMGFGLGSMVLGTFSASIMLVIGWRSTFRVLAVVFSLLSLIGAVVIVKPDSIAGLNTDYSKEIQVTTKEMVKKKSYILTLLWGTTLMSTCLVILGHAALCASDIGATPYVAALSSGLVSVCNVITRGFLGANINRIGLRITQIAITIIGILSSAICLFGYANKILFVMLIGYAMLGFLNGGITMVMNTYIMQKFGMENFGINMAVTNIHMIFACLLGPAIAGLIKTYYGSYDNAFIVMMIFSSFALITLLYNRKDQDPKKVLLS